MPNKPKSPTKPPAWVVKLLTKLCKDHLLEEIEGDLLESYGLWRQRYGQRRADLLYIRNGLKFLRPYALEKFPKTKKHPSMLSNHFTISFRHILRNKGYSALNLLSLSLGMIAFVLIHIWVDFERSVDNFHQNEARLYAMYFNVANADQGADATDGSTAGYQLPFSFRTPNYDLRRDFTDELKGDLPGIEMASEYHTLYDLPWGYPHTFRFEDIIHKVEGSVAENDFLSMFSMELLAGSFNNALASPHQIVISRRMSDLFFDQPSDAIGKALRYEDRQDLVVAAVFADLPLNSSLTFDYLLSWEMLQNREISLSSNQAMTLLLLNEDTNPEHLTPLLKDYLDERLSATPIDVNLGMIPFHLKHLYTDFEMGVPQGGKIEYLNFFSIVGLFILALAAINFSGLATARSVKRSKEIGIRKVIGSSKQQVVSQFMIEAIILSILAMVFSLVAIVLLLPTLSSVIGLQLQLPIYDLDFWLFMAAITLATSVSSGTYPAFYLASQRVKHILKKDFRLSPSAIIFQKGLVIFQSFLATAMLLGTLVVYQQTQFVKNSNLGYERENIIYLPVEGELIEKYNLFKDQLLMQPGIAAIDRSSEAPHAMNFEVVEPIKWQGKEPGQQVGFYPTSVGFEYLEMMGIAVAEGRGFSKQINSDSTAFMINEMAVREMGLEDPVGKWISAWDKKGQIVGILKDYHINSLHQPIRPLIMDVKEGLEFGKILIKTRPGQLQAALESTERVAKALNPNYAVDIKFLDFEYEQLYRREETASKLGNAFTAIAIFIACLGLVGLAVVSAEQRRKEMGIRKVLGASVSHLVGIFSRQFVRLVGIAAICSIPVTTYFLSDWLQGFAYHIDLSWHYYVWAIGLSLGLSFLSIAIQAIQTALSNPIDTLKLDG